MDAEIIDAETIQQVISDIRNENNATNWILLTYESPKSQKLVFAGQGEGGVDEMKTLFTDEGIFFGLVRDIDQIDESLTVKFAFIEWIGDKSPRLQKARISMQLGAIQSFFGQYHVSHMCSHQDEISSELILEKIKNASGSASHVL
ncbi:Coactosin [Entamoeba marina]